MSWYTRMLRETCTYWAPAGANAYGDMVYASAASLSCRWEERAQLFTDRNGTQSHSRAVVLLAEEIAAEGKLYYGESDEDSPDSVAGTDLIRAVERVKTIRGNVTQWTAFL